MKSIDDVFAETIVATQIFIVEDHFNNLNQQLNKKSFCDIFLKDAKFLNHLLEGNHQISFYILFGLVLDNRLNWSKDIDNICS